MESAIVAAIRALHVAHLAIETAKPNDRTALDRISQVALTDLEKLIAYYTYSTSKATSTFSPLP